MISKIVVVALLCVAYTLAEAPVNRYRYQRVRQAPPRNFFARQEQVPYPAVNKQGGEPKPEYGPPKPTYGPPPSTTPAPEYGPPANGDSESTNPDSEAVGQPSRLTAFSALPTKKAPQKFSQRLELQQQVKQFPGQQQFIAPVQSVVAPVQPVAVAAPLQLTAIQPDGSYFIQLPSGSIQRVNYLPQPGVVDGSVFANLRYSPVAEVQTSVAEPNLYVNTLVQSHVTAEDEQQ